MKQRRSHCTDEGDHGPPLQFLKQQFQFQTSGILLFAGVKKLFGPEISRFLPCMLQFSDNLPRLLRGNR